MRSNKKRPASPAEDSTSIKKQKVSSIDPLDTQVLHEDVHRFITQHLSGNDLLAGSEVSTKWNAVMEGCKIGDKVELDLQLPDMTPKDKQIIKKSSRVYKNVSLVSNELTAADDTIDGIFGSVENLTAHVVGRAEWPDLPQLKNLDLTVVDDSEDIWSMESRMDQLEELKLQVNYNGCHICRNFKVWPNFITKLSNLKRLDLSDSSSDFLDFYDMQIQQPLFRLEHINASLPHDDTEFINSQRETLQTLIDTGGSCKPMVSAFLRDFPKLTELEMTGCNCNWAFGDEILPVNTTIKKLQISEFSFESTREILLSLPNLETLDVEELDVDLMEFVAENLKNLKQLIFEYSLDFDEVLERYKEMKRNESEQINAGIELKDKYD